MKISHYALNYKMKMKAVFRYLPIALIIFIGAAYCFLSFNIPFLGDDLGFYSSFAAQDDCWYAFPRSMYRQWLWNNARLADMLMPVTVYILPAWCRGLVTGSMFSLFFYLLAFISVGSVRKHPFGGIAIIFLAAFTFRWDAIWMEFATFNNYVWTTAFGLLAFLILQKMPRQKPNLLWWLAVPFCFAASAMHEAFGVPFAAGLIVYIVVSDFRKNSSLLKKVTMFSIIFGGLFTLTSPASYSRIGSMLQPEPTLEMLCFSGFYVIILIVLIVWLAVFRSQILSDLVRSTWIIFTVGALLSCIMMIVSQYGGRTGWFAQCLALIAIADIFQALNIRFPKPLQFTAGILMALAIVAHYCAVSVWQKRLATQTREIIALYQKSPEGIVYYDYLNEPELPWYLLRKTHGVPDDDDTYYRYRMARYYGNGKPLIVLPEKASDIDWNNLNDSIHIGKFIIASDSLGNSYPDMIVDIFPRRMLQLSDKEYIQLPFTKSYKTYYLYSPVDRDRGEK
ncbi:MAG: hypothetical protein K2K97_03020 [Muribaculaceae bacterium]|nr:hypothetical protein [Muribaculaceae bacterium]